MEKKNIIPTPMGMSYDKIQKLNTIRPFDCETERERKWYEIGLIDGVEAAELKFNPEIALLRAIASKTAQMREMQKLYFKTRASGILEKSKQLEREVDTALTQLKDLTQPKQQSLTF